MMRIGQAARELGINPRTIRYYESIGLVPEPPRSPSGYRLYGEEDLERLAFILRARALDLTLEDIREILAFRERGEAPCRYVAGLIDEKIAQVEARIEALRLLRKELEELSRAAQELPPQAIQEKHCICHILEG